MGQPIAAVGGSITTPWGSNGDAVAFIHRGLVRCQRVGRFHNITAVGDSASAFDGTDFYWEGTFYGEFVEVGASTIKRGDSYTVSADLANEVTLSGTFLVQATRLSPDWTESGEPIGIFFNGRWTGDVTES